IHEIQKFVDRVTHTKTTVIDKIDHLSIKSIAHSTPFILLNVLIWQDESCLSTLMEPGQPGNECLTQRCDSKSILNGSRHIEDTYLNGIKKWMWPDIPPNSSSIVDTSLSNQGLYIVIKV